MPELLQMNLPRLNQVGILVKDMSEAIACYSRLLNVKPWYRSNTVSHEALYRGKPVSTDTEIALAFQGATEIELIQVKHHEDCVYSDLLAKSGGGLHHVGFIVSGYDEKLARMKANGIDVLQSGVITTKGSAVTRYAYLDTVKECGIISELIETRLIGLRMPHSRIMMEIGCLTGDVKRL